MFVLFLVSWLFVLVACSQSPEGNIITIGAVEAFNPIQNIEQLLGMQIWKDWVNNNGGIEVGTVLFFSYVLCAWNGDKTLMMM